MKFSTREDIEAPIDAVFARLTDYDQFERQALRRGASVRRLDPGPVDVGTRWDVAFKFRGRERRLRATIAAIESPQFLKIASDASGIDSNTMIELVPLSPNRTRLSVALELSAKTLSARLLLQSFKLAKSNLNNRFSKRIEAFAEDIEDRFRAGA